jgi:hypothetical protein
MKASFVGDTGLIANRRTVVNKFMINRSTVSNAEALRKSRLSEDWLEPFPSMRYAFRKI